MSELQLHDAQKEIARDPHRFRVVCAGRRFGKSFLVVDQMKARAAIPNSRIAYIAPTYQQARDIVWAQLKKDCEQAAATINESRLEIVLVNGSSIVLRGWENIETLRGQNFHLIMIDEVAMMRNFWINWREVIRPTLTDFVGEGIFISTPKGFNHFYDLYNMENDPEKGKDYKSFHYTTYDNPYMPEEEIEAAKKELTEDAFAQEYLADFRKTAGLVYKEFDRDKHLIKDVDAWYQEHGQSKVRSIAGVDFGYVHPAGVAHIEETSDGVFIVTDEWYETEKTDEQIAEYVSAQRFNSVYPDPANAGGVEELRRQGCNVRNVNKGKVKGRETSTSSIIHGIQIVRELFKANRLFVASHCTNLIFELETYSYGEEKERTGGDRDELPIKENDHLLDALRYCLMSVHNRRGYNKAVVRKPTWRGFNVRA